MTATYLRDIIDANPIVGVRKSGPKRFWTLPEERILRETYARGVEACVRALPGRSASSIYNHAGKLGLSFPTKPHDFRRQKWSTNDQIDAAIRRAYEKVPTKNAINDLARTLGRPRWWVSKRAVTLGLVTPRFKEPPWSEAEIELVAANAHKNPVVIARRLKACGFARSATAIVVKIKRLGYARGRNADPDNYTARACADMFGVDVKVVTGWVAKSWLKAGRRGTDRTKQQGGDEHWIHRRDIRAFIIANVAVVDFRKVDKFWLVEILTGDR